MPTLTEFRQRMLQLAQGELGRVEDIASLTTTTAVVTALATGTIGAGKFAEHWMLRPNSGSLPDDRVRFTSAFASATGTLTHAGSNYTDTTATSEQVEILTVEPALLDNAIQEALRRSRFRDFSVIPTWNADRYWLTGLPWIKDPADVEAVSVRPYGELNRNRRFEKWFGYSAGALVPDDWTLSGSGATFARVGSPVRGAYGLAMVRASAAAVAAQTVSILRTGVAADSLIGQTVTAVAVVQQSDANQGRVIVADAGLTSTSELDATVGAVELSVEHEVTATASSLALQVRNDVDSSILTVDEAYLIRGSLTDAHRRHQAQHRTLERDREYTFEQSAVLQLVVPHTPIGHQLVIESERPYEPFTQSRITAGTADADENDAPLDLIAHRALAIFYEARSRSRAASPTDAANADLYRRIADQLQAQHLVVPNRGGLEIPGGTRTPVTHRLR